MTKAISIGDVPEKRGSMYPEPYAKRMGDRAKRKLGDAFGLTQFGVNMTTLAPGGQSALRHWHTQEDELVYVLEGELVLVTDAGEQLMRAGDVVGFRAGASNAHHFLNRGPALARYIEVGSRVEGDIAHYPDDDLQWIIVDGEEKPAHKDGTPW